MIINRSTRFYYLLMILFSLIALPGIVLAVSSTNYIIDPSSTDSIRHSSTSTSYQLEGAIEPIVGTFTSTTYKLESGSSFKGYCGDGFIDPTEDCEGSDLNSKTCITQGYASGTLTCSSSCTFVYTACRSGGGGGGGGGGGSVLPTAPTFDSALNSFTYLSSPLIYGVKETTVTSIYVNNSTDGVTYPTASRWQKTVPFVLGSNTVVIKAWNSYGYSSEVTKTITRRQVGDVNADSAVNDYDFSLLANHWGQNWAEADFNGSRLVDDYDLSLMVAYWTS